MEEYCRRSVKMNKTVLKTVEKKVDKATDTLLETQETLDAFREALRKVKLLITKEYEIINKAKGV